MKHVICIQDLSCFGKCSLSVVLPVLSAAGIQTSVLPTALLSTHTGGLGKPYIRDLHEDMVQIRNHWAQIPFSVDAIYSGYVSNIAQLKEVERMFEQYPDSLHVVDPVMGDDGLLYGSLPPELPEHMLRLCQKADLITPNMTEAYALVKEPFQGGPYTEAEIKRLAKKLHQITQADIVLTGVYHDNIEIGCICFQRKDERIHWAMNNKASQNYHGTGDLYTSSLLGAYLNQHPLSDAIQVAANYTTKCIEYSQKHRCNEPYGVYFEPLLEEYITLIHEDFPSDEDKDEDIE